MMRLLSLALGASFVALVATFASAGCGPSSDTPSDAGADADAGKPKPKDAAIEAAPYVPKGVRCTRDPNAVPPTPWTPPSLDGGVEAGDGGADLPRAPAVVSSDGTVAPLPVFVPVTFDGDDARDEIEDFVASVGCTSYWRQVANEYGIGDGITGTPIHLAEAAPSTITDAQIRSWLVKKVQSDPRFASAGVNVLYAIFYPEATTITFTGGTSCGNFGGYHSSTSTIGKAIPYAVMPRCGSSIDTLTNVTSHEFIEYATDPVPGGYQNVDEHELAWGIFGSSEVGDMCEFGKGASYVPSDYPFEVQRSWSNKAAWLRQDPCVPAIGATYFVAAPVIDETVTVDYFGVPMPTRGVKLAKGASRTIDVKMMATGSTADWTVSAVDLSPSLGGGPTLKFTFDKTTGNAGDVLKLTLQRIGTNGSTNAAPFVIRSSQKGGDDHSWYGVAGD